MLNHEKEKPIRRLTMNISEHNSLDREVYTAHCSDRLGTDGDRRDQDWLLQKPLQSRMLDYGEGRRGEQFRQGLLLNRSRGD